MIQQTKRPGAAATASEPVSNVRTPEKDRDMNMQSSSTAEAAVPDFPLYAANQGAHDDLARLTGRLRIVSYMLEDCIDRGISSGTASDLLSLLCDVIEDMKPIQLFMDEMQGTPSLYRECRRRVILESARRAAA